MYSPDLHTVSIERSVKFDSGNINVYLRQVIPIEGEWKLSIENLSKSPVVKPVVEEPVKPIDTVDPLGEDFERLPEPEEGCPKCVCQESVAIQRLHAGEGVIRKEHSQIQKGIQQVHSPGDVEEAEIVEIAELDELAVAVIGPEIDELEPSYQEARKRSDWQSGKRLLMLN